MPSLPIPLISSLILGFLLIRMLMTNRRHGPLIALLALSSVQGLIISLAQHYHVAGFLTIQPIAATMVPPLAWVAFQTTAARQWHRSDICHLAGPIVAIACLISAPALLDTVIPLLFALYGAAILWHGSQGADALPQLRLEAGDRPGLIWQIIGIALIASALSDVMIVAVQQLGMHYLQPWIISIYSSITLLVIGGLSLSQSLIPAASDEDPTTDSIQTTQDIEIVAKLDALMHERKLYLDPDLSLSQLSRKMMIPVKQLSIAINRVTHENVSRYINRARISAAQDALMAGETITSAMLSSGFNTKSNFNREFLRVAGKNPSDWRADMPPTAKV